MTREIGDIVRLFQGRAGDSFALATLFAAHGSSYRRPGARMLVSSGNQVAGSVSGGCLEREVIACAQEVLQTGAPKVLRFDLRKRFGCHGEIEILVEVAENELLLELAECYAARRRCWALTSLNSPKLGTRLFQQRLLATSHQFLQEITPPIQLVVIGEGPENPSMQHIADSLGWHWQCGGNPAELNLTWDEWTAALVKTHNYGRDFAALRFVLPLPLRYVGLLGPKRRKAQLLGDLLEAGVVIPKHFFAPAGQNIGGDTPESVALAVVAEIHAVFASRPGNHLRDLSSPIHGDRADLRNPRHHSPTQSISRGDVRKSLSLVP